MYTKLTIRAVYCQYTSIYIYTLLEGSLNLIELSNFCFRQDFLTSRKGREAEDVILLLRYTGLNFAVFVQNQAYTGNSLVYTC